ncbi:MAG: hypothetical protein AW09_004389 [Candidatus Accumulibacter phosphatis]|uniref:Uncharacterized protein n=1 Tax=Candidatus Accumulibacter phosphatis TaxID=327160 RepID=A0A084Y722_9PROT|nr:MAG: hypothetical protein AW09_004389 [Candidatus Accumulibacter phosphatis]
MSIGSAPRQGQRGYLAARIITLAIQHAPDGLINRHSVRVPMMQAFDIDVELVAQPLQALRFGAPGVGIDAALRRPGCLQLCQDVELSGFAGMQFKAELTETDFAQAPVDHIERRHLLGDEEYALALGQALRDEVGDGLTLAGPRWSDEDEVLAAHGGDDRRKLR